MGDVVLKLDADAARYVSEIVKAAERTKDLGKGAKEARDHFAGAGDIIEAGTAKLGRMVTGAALLAAGSSAVSAIYKDWASHLERAGKAFKDIDDRMRGAAGTAGDIAKLGDARDRIAAMSSPLSLNDRASAALAVRNASPSASIDQMEEGVSAAGAGRALGIDPTAFGTGYGKLLKGFGSEAGDVTGLLHQRDTGNAGAAIELLAKIGMTGGSNARDSLSLVSAAGRNAGGLDALSELHGKYEQMRIFDGSRESFGPWARKQTRFMVSAGNQPGFDATMEGFGAEEEAIGRGSHAGYLDTQVRAVRGNASDRSRLDTESIRAHSEAVVRRKYGERENSIAQAEALDEQIGDERGYMKLGFRRQKQFARDVLNTDAGTAASELVPAIGILKLILGQSEEQTNHARELSRNNKPRPAIGTQGEGGR